MLLAFSLLRENVFLRSGQQTQRYAGRSLPSCSICLRSEGSSTRGSTCSAGSNRYSGIVLASRATHIAPPLYSGAFGVCLTSSARPVGLIGDLPSLSFSTAIVSDLCLKNSSIIVPMSATLRFRVGLTPCTLACATKWSYILGRSIPYVCSALSLSVRSRAFMVLGGWVCL